MKLLTRILNEILCAGVIAALFLFVLFTFFGGPI